LIILIIGFVILVLSYKLMRRKLDFLFLGVLGVIILFSVNMVVEDNYIISGYGYAGFISFLAVFILRLFTNKIGRYGLGIILIAGTLNCINFSVIRSMIPFGIDPLIFLITTAYFIINKNSFSKILFTIIYGNQKERGNSYQKKVDFYFEKFSKYDGTEFEKIFKDFKEYPSEAQVALNKIKQDALLENHNTSRH
jgi:hypothetical protein